MNRPFQPPAIPSLDVGFAQQFYALRDYLTRLFFPYLFDYLNDITIQPLNQLRFSLTFVEAPDGVRTSFTLAEGKLRLLPQGTAATIGTPGTIGTPQALIWSTNGLLQYVTNVGALTPTTWTLVITGTPPMQQIVVGAAPAAGAEFFMPVGVIA